MRGYDYSGVRLIERPQAAAPDSAFIQPVVPTGHADSVDRSWRGVVTCEDQGWGARWKYAVLERQPWLMFNLSEDPYELMALAHNTRYRREHKRLQDRLVQWLADRGDTFRIAEV